MFHAPLQRGERTLIAHPLEAEDPHGPEEVVGGAFLRAEDLDEISVPVQVLGKPRCRTARIHAGTLEPSQLDPAPAQCGDDIGPARTTIRLPDDENHGGANRIGQTDGEECTRRRAQGGDHPYERENDDDQPTEPVPPPV